MRPSLALRFTSGKYKGGEFPLRPDREIYLGRQADLEVVLVEDLVSRRHSRISTKGGELWIDDLGSTNGTFVNGHKVTRSPIKEGDRILLGTSLMRVVRVTEEARSEEQAREDLAGRGRRTSGHGRFSGDLSEVPLPDLLQLLCTGKKNGALRVDGSVAGGIIYLREGRIVNAELDDVRDAPARKALFRMLGWAEGLFDLDATAAAPAETLSEGTEALLLDAMREIDELRRIAEGLPGDDEPLALARPLPRRLRDLRPEELDLLELAHGAAQVGAVIDQTQLTDYESWKALASLIERGYLTLG